jgi:hypothetical protein
MTAWDVEGLHSILNWGIVVNGYWTMDVQHITWFLIMDVWSLA